MEIVNEQYADKEYEKPIHTHKHSCYQISNKIWIIVSLAFVWLSIWNFVYVSQLTMQTQIHTMKLQQLKHDISILFKMFQNVNEQLPIPIMAKLNDLQHSNILNNNNEQNDINGAVLAQTLKDYDNQEVEVITDKFAYNKKDEEKEPSDGKREENAVKIIYKKYNNTMNQLAEEVNLKSHFKAMESSTFQQYNDHENNYVIKEQLKRSKRSHVLYADIGHELDSETSQRHSNKPIETTVKRATTVSSTLMNNKPAAHFHINRSIPDSYSDIRIHPYRGDLYIGHPSWTNDLNVAKDFHIENGILRVNQPGLYYVYAQICYNNSHDHNGFIIFHGHKPFLQCLNTIPTNLSSKLHTCHTSGLIYLKSDEKLHLRDFHRDRNAILKDSNYRSYFGLMKI